MDAAPAVSVDDPEAKALFEAKCSLCHPLSRPLRKSRERKWWIETVTRMQKVNGCPITDEEAWRIIDYLAIVRGPGVPRGPDDDAHHEWERGAPAPGEKTGPEPGPAVPPTGGGDPGAKALFEAKCSICHSVSRPLGKTKDKAGWTETVTRMQQVNGCPITDEEAQAIIDYLVFVRGPVPDVPPTGGGDPEAKALFEAKCSICHPVSRPLGKTKDRSGWTATVTRMKDGNGCPITDAEAGVIIDYLTKIRGPVVK